MPSRGRNRMRRVAVFHTTARICAASSLREKYQWPEGAKRRLLTSPSTHTSKKSVSRTPCTRSVSSETVRARRGSGRAGSVAAKSSPRCSMFPENSSLFTPTAQRPNRGGTTHHRQEQEQETTNSHSCERSGIHSRGASGWARGARSRAKRDERQPRVYDATRQHRTSDPGGRAASAPQLRDAGRARR